MALFYLTVERSQAKSLTLQALVRRAIINMKWNWLRHSNTRTDISFLSVFGDTF